MNRFWPLTKNTPKPLIKINKKPLDYIKNLSRQNIEEIILICFKFQEFKKNIIIKKFMELILSVLMKKHQKEQWRVKIN